MDKKRTTITFMLAPAQKQYIAPSSETFSVECGLPIATSFGGGAGQADPDDDPIIDPAPRRPFSYEEEFSHGLNRKDESRE